MNESEIFKAAVKLSVAERGSFLDSVCKDDPELRGQVEALLKAHYDSATFLQDLSKPTDRQMTETVSQPMPTENPGTIIAGRYKLLQEIGEGGMGSVWLAEQAAPVKRKVAIKLIKAGMDSRQVLARFDAERQAIALMDHPNIAKVYDGGVTEQGRPYFVMEYVKGIPLTEYCDQARLSLAERLKLFASVCQAVQHAHQKGIIHRDLKPSNILACLYDGQPVPKVIDFGLAKAMHQSLAEQSLFTAHGMMVGTPLYMSPEQAEHNKLDVDTRTDIYSLGVILYELLTGSTPLEKQQLKDAAFNEILRLIKEVEPQKPSTRLSGSASLPSVAAQRSIEPNQLRKSLVGDLDWIVMKALDKERSRRYETANGLARDIDRYLNDEAVEACPPSTTYRLKKLLRRNKGSVAAVSAIAATLLMATCVSVWFGLSEARQRAETETQRAEAVKQAGIAETNAADARKQQALAESNAAAEVKARNRAEAINTFVTQALQTSDPKSTGKRNITIAEAIENAIKEIESGAFQDEPEIEASLRDTIGTILMNNGEIEMARPLFERALAINERLYEGDDPILVRSLNNLAGLLKEQGQYTQAEPLFLRALAISEKYIDSEYSDLAASLNNLASIYAVLGRSAQAEPLFLRALALNEKAHGSEHPNVAICLGNLAQLYADRGESLESERAFKKSLGIWEKAKGRDHPLTATCMTGLAILYLNLGRLDDAESLLSRALTIREEALGTDHPELANSLVLVASLYTEQGRYSQAEPLFKRALVIQEAKLGPEHSRIANSLNHLAQFYEKQGQRERCEPLYLRVIKINENSLGPDHPVLADSLNDLGSLYYALGKIAEAEPLHVRALAIREKSLGPDHYKVALSLYNLGTLYWARGRRTEAEPLYQRALDIIEIALGQDQANDREKLNILKGIYKSKGNNAKLEMIYQRSLGICEKTFGPDHPEVAKVLSSMATFQRENRQFTQAESLYKQALTIREKAFPADHPDVLLTKGNLAALYWSKKELDKSVPLFEEVFKAQEENLGREHARTLQTIANLGVNYKDAGRLDDAIPLLEEAYRASKKYPEILFAGPQLLDAYTKTADSNEPESIARASDLIRELCAELRKTHPNDSVDLAGQLVPFSTNLLGLKAWNEAETLLREILTIREAKSPDDWRTYNTKSMLGAAILGQRKYAEAEPILVAGYEGIRARDPGKIPDQYRIRLREALERLVELYTVWHAAEPDKGYDAKAAQWQKKLDEFNATTTPKLHA